MDVPLEEFPAQEAQAAAARVAQRRLLVRQTREGEPVEPQVLELTAVPASSSFYLDKGTSWDISHASTPTTSSER